MTKPQVPNTSCQRTSRTVSFATLHHLRRAIVERNAEMVEIILQQGADVNRAIGGVTPLNNAVYAGSLLVINILLKFGAKVNQSSVCPDSEEGEEEFPILSASRGRNRFIVQMLIDHGASVNVLDSAQFSSLYYASMKGSEGIARLLLENGANVNKRVGCKNTSPLIVATKWGYNDLMKLLISHGAEVNIVDNDDNTPLHYAVDRGLDGNKAILKANAKLNSLNNENQTPLWRAVSSQQIKVIAALLKSGAKINSGRPLHYDSLLNEINQETVNLIQLFVITGLRLEVISRRLTEESLEQLKESKDLCDWLEYRLHNPLSLKQQCRFVIRNCLVQISDGTSILEYLNNLPVPGIICRFLALEDI